MAIASGAIAEDAISTSEAAAAPDDYTITVDATMSAFTQTATLSQPTILKMGTLYGEVLYSVTPNLRVGGVVVEVLKSATPYYFPVSSSQQRHRRR